MKNKALLMAITAIIIIGAVSFWIFGKRVTEKATLGGTVTFVKEVGAEVKEGDPLLRVKGLTGNAVAARATIDGTVIKVMVKSGDEITPKTEVLVIKEK